MKLLGIDPGTASTGFGVISVDGSTLRAIEHGVIETGAGRPPTERLAAIHRRVAELIDLHRPASVAMEDLFVGANPRNVLTVGQARGAVMTACGLVGLEAAAYPPAEVKAAVCGYGRADKQQVQRMVGAMLAADLAGTSDHATDALAVAICHAVRTRGRRLVEAAAG
jgi:crossover junction endodeoxyribonuclease RuvC